MGFLWFLVPLFLIFGLTSIVKTVRNFIEHYLSEFLTALGAIGLTVVDVMSESDEKFLGDDIAWKEAWVFLLITFGLLLISAIVVGARRNLHNRTVQGEIDKNQKLKEEIKLYKKEYYNLCSNNILHLFKSFYTTGGERISIYKHHGDHFTLLGRCAMNKAYNQASEYKYKEDEGLIGDGWVHGEAFVTGAPQWVNKGKTYIEFMRARCVISERRLKKIRMKSRSIYVKTLNDVNTAANPDGIIVFESMSPTKVEKAECATLISSSEKALLALLKDMSSLTTNLNR
ncbi:hypothetical protein [Pontibacter populi]|uniref:Uncharacterized protein n=1 Tax=Pontibacter populi TaxID=890055 RepID=A0ABV1RSP0_9BACT